MKKTLIGILILLLSLPLLAQIDMPKPNLNPYKGSGTPLFGLNKLSMSHSLGFEAGTSSSGRGYYLSRYTNHINYAFNPKLDLELDLSLVNYGSTSKLQFNSDNNTKVIPEFRLNYRPSDSVNLSVEFGQGTLWYTGPSNWYSDQRPRYERW
ncbi:MAG TPA: hypothetical protein PLI58_02205 [Candidatus Syntrophosphaera sp.]|jgi:opacity protein-like surface antigen|nr:hypothetical protein [Candidatus Cloacimonadota bacterium]HOR02778.1 hypothetical protein [Candidatus Syntrophosphaera sp.]HOG31191.1 hypothetical protein [Candidatus Cloacimonadota bacterium]HOU72291.1 hypothetical protein [Candidatus Syntrophosphaera sp.]HPK82513.1 hypothetical protein [Candidatus Syntrophosphaera sp.]